MTNRLYYGDNLDILRRYVADESVDLVYLDPPFNSQASYNVLFAEKSGKRAAAQIKVFEDTWEWDQGAALAFAETVERGGPVADALRAFRTFLGESDMMAYLAMMAPRLAELRRVMKPTASLYLHCDPTASHYLKMLLDAVFGPQHFKSEVIWKRTLAHSSAKRFGPVHDVILFYTRGEVFTWNHVRGPLEEGYVESHFRKSDDSGPFQDISLTGAGARQGESGAPWRGLDPTAKGRHWAIPGAVVEKMGIDGALSVQARLDALDAAGRVYWPKSKGESFPRLKWYVQDSSGSKLSDIWTDIPPINSQAQERLGYPTQKPEALLERILAASSDDAAVVLDPFCGCGTTIAAAQKLGRRWIGIDITHLAIGLIKTRLRDTYGTAIEKTYHVTGEPTTPEGAQELAGTDQYQFQWWALGLVGARPVEQKKGADKGIDGRILFHDEGPSGKTKQVIFSVKAGKLHAPYVRDLVGVIAREEAAIGVLISLDDPTKPMKAEAASHGFYSSPWGKHPRLQLITVAELLDGRRPDLPTKISVTFKQAPKAERKGRQPGLGFGDDGDEPF